jgi:hypothetical protein
MMAMIEDETRNDQERMAAKIEANNEKSETLQGTPSPERISTKQGQRLINER